VVAATHVLIVHVIVSGTFQASLAVLTVTIRAKSALRICTPRYTTNLLVAAAALHRRGVIVVTAAGNGARIGAVSVFAACPSKLLQGLLVGEDLFQAWHPRELVAARYDARPGASCAEGRLYVLLLAGGVGDNLTLVPPVQTE